MSTIIYCRYSSDMQRPESCSDQERKVREYLLRNNIPAGEIIVLKDEAISGTKEARDAYDGIKSKIDRREPFVLAVDDQSRLSRGDNVKGLIRDLVFAGGRFISAGENIDTAQDGWELKVGIMEIHNSLTITELSRRVRRGQEGRVLDDGSAGDYGFGYRSYYLDSNWQEAASRRGPKPKKGIRTYDSEVAVVQRVFRDFVAGRSISEITGDLNLEGVDKGHRSSRPGWHHQQIRRMLSNRKYIGWWTWGRTRITRNSAGKKKQVAVAKHEVIERERPELRIIDDDTWGRAQERLAALYKTFGRKEHQKRRGPKPHYTETYPRSLLGGLLFCGTCGARLVYQYGGPDVYYGCPQHRKRLCAQTVRVPKRRGEEGLLSFLQDELRRRPEWVSTVLEAMRARLKELSARVPAEVEARSAERVKLEREIDNLTSAIAERGTANGSLTEALNTREARLEVVLRDLSGAQKLASAQMPLPDDAWVHEQLANMADVLRDDPRQAALLLRRVLGKVAVHEVRLPGKKRGYPQLRFHFSGWKATEQAVRSISSPSLLNDVGPEYAQREVVLDLGAPTRMDQWAPKIDQMRRDRVPWNEICRVTGLASSNAYFAWRRWKEAQDALSETA